MGYAYYKGSLCVTTEIVTEKFDVLRDRLKTMDVKRN